jgi:serine/threonine protein kinase
MSIDKSNYIAKGTYGCVIKPSFDCNNNKKITNSVAKLFIFKEDWKKEIQENNIIKNLDSTNKFTIKMLNYCEISSDFLNKNVNNINKCDKNNKEIIYQIIYEDGGIDLRKLFQDIPNNFDYNNFLNKLKEIFQGLIILKNNNLCHRDIKLDNLLYNKNNNKISLIDFGLMVNFDDIYNYDNFNIYLYNNSYYYPNELKIYSLIKLNKTLSFENLTYNSDNLINYLKYTYEKIKNYENINNILTNIRTEKDIYQNYIKKNKEEINNPDYKNKIDVYLFGVVLFEIIINIIIQTKNKNKYISFLTLIEKMLKINPMERISIEDAFNEYSKLLNT